MLNSVCSVKTHDQAVCCAGLAYAMSCHLLQRSPTVLPGGTISKAELQGLAQAASTSAAGRFASMLFGFARVQLDGPWHTLPDLLTCLSTSQFGAPCMLLHLAGGIMRARTTKLLLSSCTLPQNPIPPDDVLFADPDILPQLVASDR